MLGLMFKPRISKTRGVDVIQRINVYVFSNYRALQRIYKLDSYDGDWNNKARNIVHLVLVSINRRDEIKLVEELISVLNEWLDIYGILLEDGV